MTDHIFDPRPGWLRRRTFELQETGMRYADAREQAEAEADDKFAALRQLEQLTERAEMVMENQNDE
ncbi:hypothetical protein Mycsm_05349 [Mycobacterium sp. JS623]|uniref:hypothetical protein n=1 Tax=Mycobacterium sp. JS623 TaxID=212767 RepID=UPI0002A5B87A|nr:hypothetical protein [Mycobacterium sp. JS623]AGB25541.1 hypothetical protein Mycsm_05349 [Mycobacterium sp. JS623]